MMMQYCKKFLLRQFSSSSQSVGAVNVKKRGKVMLISLDGGGGENGNRLSIKMAENLVEAISSFENDSSIRAGILHGELGTFCAGYSLSLDPFAIHSIDIMLSSSLLNKFTSKPLVAAVNGYATGIGFDLALWCDLRIVEETSVLACYATQYGYPLSSERAERLSSMMGLNRALDLILTGRVMKPKEALESSIATRVVACGTGIGQAMNLAASLANMPESCLKSDRAALHLTTTKFSKGTQDSTIEHHFQVNHMQALQEHKEGKHITKSGDVRRQKG